VLTAANQHKDGIVAMRVESGDPPDAHPWLLLSDRDRATWPSGQAVSAADDEAHVVVPRKLGIEPGKGEGYVWQQDHKGVGTMDDRRYRNRLGVVLARGGDASGSELHP
jgi:hypothetical protein